MSDENQHAPRALNVAGALTDAQRIIREAERRADELRIVAESDALQAKNLGYAEGFEQGRREALEQAVRLLSDTGRLRVQLAEESASLAMAISSKVVAEHVKVDPTVVRRIALSAVRQLPIAKEMKIVCHPEDLIVLERALPELQQYAGGEVVLVPESSFIRGGCLIKSVFGEADASVEALLEKVAYLLGVSFTAEVGANRA